MTRHVLAVLSYLVATFAVQGLSHFAVNKAHYAAVAHMRADAIIPFGMLAMIVQGTVLSIAYTRMGGKSLFDSVRFAWLAGAFLVSYIAFGEAGKYVLPSIASWITVEVIAGFAQFTLYGGLLGLVYRCIRSGANGSPPFLTSRIES